MVSTKPPVMSAAVAQAEDVKHGVLSANSWNEPSVEGRLAYGLLHSHDNDFFFASFFTAGSAEPVITHPAPKGTCWKATVPASRCKSKGFQYSGFFWYKPERSCLASGKRQERSPTVWEEGLRAAAGIAVLRESCRCRPPRN